MVTEILPLAASPLFEDKNQLCASVDGIQGIVCYRIRLCHELLDLILVEQRTKHSCHLPIEM